MFLKLFLTFLEIGAVSFGGGYGMISLIREKVLLNGWLSEAEFLSFIAVSESTPGPLAVNMATFIGASQGGVPGAFCATLGVVLPSFFIILLIAALIHDLLKYAGVEAFLSGVRPCVVALILSTAFTMGLSTLLGISTAAETPSPAWRGIGILAILAGVRLIWQKARGKAPSPIGMILLSAVLGAVLLNKKERHLSFSPMPFSILLFLNPIHRPGHSGPERGAGPASRRSWCWAARGRAPPPGGRASRSLQGNRILPPSASPRH